VIIKTIITVMFLVIFLRHYLISLAIIRPDIYLEFMRKLKEFLRDIEERGKK
jgi:hypothetical protein